MADANGTPVAGANVTFLAPAPGGIGASLSATSATTNSLGLAQTRVTSNALRGSYVVRASVAGAGSANFALTTAGSAARLVYVYGDQQTASPNAAFGTPLAVQVRDLGGTGVPGAAVRFTAQGGFASAALSNPNVVSDARGYASTSAVANGNSGDFLVVATTPGVAAAQNFALTNAAALPRAVYLVSGGNQTAPTRSAFMQPVVVMVASSTGDPVPNVEVNFAAPRTKASATFTASQLQNITVLTDSSGVASVGVSANANAGAYTVTAAARGVLATVQVPLVNDGGQYLDVNGGDGQSVLVQAPFAQPLSVLVSDVTGGGVPGVGVSFLGPKLGASAVPSTAAALTDANGIASLSVRANAVAGAYAVASTTASGGGSVNFTLRNNVGPAAILQLVSGDGQEGAVGQTSAAPIVVRVLDQAGNAVADAPLLAGAPLALNAGTPNGPTPMLPPAVVPAAAQTDAAGYASFFVTAGNYVGPAVLRFSATQGAMPTQLATLQQIAGSPVGVAVASGSLQAGPPEAKAPLPLVAVVRDAYGNAVANAAVAYQTPSAGPTGTLGLPRSSTNAQGLVATSLIFAGPAGPFQVTASLDNAGTAAYNPNAPSASFSLTDQVGPAAAIVVVSGNNQHQCVGQAYPKRS